MLDVQFDVLADRTRRRVLVSLLEAGPDEEIAVPDDVHEGERDLEVLEAELVHTHLPKLESAGLVWWDRDAATVVRGYRFEEIEPLLALVDDHADDLPAEWP